MPGSKRSGADDIISGERNNLIMWNHNLDFRQTPAYLNRDCRKEAGEPGRIFMAQQNIFAHEP